MMSKRSDYLVRYYGVLDFLYASTNDEGRLRFAYPNSVRLKGAVMLDEEHDYYDGPSFYVRIWDDTGERREYAETVYLNGAPTLHHL